VINAFALEDIAPFIDWTFFFSAWELKGRFPAILEHPQYGEAARDLYANAQALLKKIVEGKLIRARGVYGFFPANADGDDIVIYPDDKRTQEPLFIEPRSWSFTSRTPPTPRSPKRNAHHCYPARNHDLKRNVDDGHGWMFVGGKLV